MIQITFCSRNIKYFLKKKNENQNFKYQLNFDNIKINEKINNDQIYKNKKRESFQRKIDMFEKSKILKKNSEKDDKP